MAEGFCISKGKQHWNKDKKINIDMKKKIGKRNPIKKTPTCASHGNRASS